MCELVGENVRALSVAMSGKKRRAESVEAASSAVKKRAVTAKIVEKWKTDHDRELDTLTWLTYKMADCNHVDSMSCSVCTCFRAKIQGMRNFSQAFIEGTQNLRASSFKDQAASEMHKRLWMLLKKEQSTDVCQYALIDMYMYKIHQVLEKTLLL